MNVLSGIKRVLYAEIRGCARHKLHYPHRSCGTDAYRHETRFHLGGGQGQCGWNLVLSGGLAQQVPDLVFRGLIVSHRLVPSQRNQRS
jgi:hypothetical protein